MKTKIQKLREMCKRNNGQDVWAAVSFHKHNGGWLDENILPKLLDALEKADDALEFYAGNLDKGEGSMWKGDTFFIVDKFGGTNSDQGGVARQARKEISDIMEGEGESHNE